MCECVGVKETFALLLWFPQLLIFPPIGFSWKLCFLKNILYYFFAVVIFKRKSIFFTEAKKYNIIHEIQ